MPLHDLCFTPATELQRLFRSRKTSPLEVMQAVLARVDAVNPKLNAIVTLAPEMAANAAAKANEMQARKETLVRCMVCQSRTRICRKHAGSALPLDRHFIKTTSPLKTILLLIGCGARVRSHQW